MGPRAPVPWAGGGVGADVPCALQPTGGAAGSHRPGRPAGPSPDFSAPVPGGTFLLFFFRLPFQPSCELSF